MTRPVFEPTESRQIRKQGFTGDQLLRRPAPNTSAGSCGEWCRIGFQDDYVFPLGQRNFAPFDLWANHDPTVYTISVQTGRTQIQIEEDGVYAVTWSLYVDVFTPLFPTNVPIWISTQHTTWSQEEEAVMFGPLQDPSVPGGTSGFSLLASPILTGTKVFRAGPEWNPVWFCVTTGDDADSDLGVIGGDLNITYMEIVRLCALDYLQEDPNDFITSP